MRRSSFTLMVIFCLCLGAILFIKPFSDHAGLPSLTHSGIFPVNSIEEVRDYVETLIEEDYKPADILIAFDIDMTLTHPSSPEAQYPAVIKYKDIYKNYYKDYSKEVMELACMYAVSDAPQVLVENDASSVIKFIQNKGVKSIAFTAAHAGKVGKFERFEVQRYEMLKEFGINFENAFSAQEFIFKSLRQNRGNYPVFYKGVLCSNGDHGSPSKGHVMGAFLNEMKVFPKVIILVDDRKKNLESLENDLKKVLPRALLIGLEYKGGMKGETTVTQEQFTAYWKELAGRAQSSLVKKRS